MLVIVYWLDGYSYKFMLALSVVSFLLYAKLLPLSVSFLSFLCRSCGTLGVGVGVDTLNSV